jgi:hypothetical protein
MALLALHKIANALPNHPKDKTIPPDSGAFWTPQHTPHWDYKSTFSFSLPTLPPHAIPLMQP